MQDRFLLIFFTHRKHTMAYGTKWDNFRLRRIPRYERIINSKFNKDSKAVKFHSIVSSTYVSNSCERNLEILLVHIKLPSRFF